MSGVLSGFVVIFVVIAVGYLLGRRGTLGDQGRIVLTRLVFYVATPALLIDVVAHADLQTLFSSGLAVAAGTAFAVAVVYAVVARYVLRRAGPEVMVGAMASSYLNGGNLGIPIAVFVLGDASYVAPVMLFQIIVYAPIALTVLDVTTTGRPGSLRGVAASIVRNPIALGGIAGLVLSAAHWLPPEPIMDSISLLGGAAVPGALMAFGLSLSGAQVLKKGTSPRRDVAVASLLKAVAQPVLAYLLGRFGLGLDGHVLFAVVVVAALPTAQNVFIYASRYGRGMVLARDAALVTTIAAVPVILVVTALLG
ncbi:AEC family transporter [Tomitella fengzijianii]|uniref:AEC family transporter n=1 Tax=Tomitella fengzijianii TaxID=2597660 RepID=A0A516X6S2_9ACTN|nr:AEC family transporter [Tomitella fengzijianii]QDQ98750.1 AEC family transporter [Tomitella fengzijianii]